MLKSFYAILAGVVFSLAVAPLQAGDVKAEDFLPENTFAAFLISDLATARDAAVKTQLGEMYAQPEMQEFLAPAMGAIRTQYDAIRMKNPMLPAWADVDGGLLSGEIALALYARPNDAQTPVGLVISLLPKDPEAFKRVLPPPMRGAIVDGFQMPMGGTPNDPMLTVAGSRLIFCVPGSEAPVMAARAKDAGARAKSLATNAEFKLVREKCSKSAALFYGAPARAVELIVQASAQNAAADIRPVLGAIKALGLDAVNSFAMGVGFAGNQPIMENYTGFKEPPKNGLFALFLPQGPCAPEAMSLASVDSPYAGAMYFDIAGVMPLIKRVIAGAVPEAAQQVGMFEAMGQQQLGLDIEKELLAHLGGHITFAQTPLHTAAPLTFSDGVVFSIPCKNPQQVERALAKLGERANQLLAMGREQEPMVGLTRYKTMKIKEGTIHYIKGMVSSQGAVMVHGDRLLMATSAYPIKRTVEFMNKKAGSILESKDFQASIARISGKPFDAKALPPVFAYGVDASSGTGTLVLTGVGLVGATAAVAGMAEIPAPPVAPAPGEKPKPAAADPQAIKRNEEHAFTALRSLVEAQEIYHRTDYDKDGMLEYAQALKGANSLFEIEPETGDLELIDEEVANAAGNPGPETHYHGYRFKLLKGSDAAEEFGGKKSFMTGGNLTLGYAFVAYPLAYNVTGTKTFLISSAGTVLEKDLGEKTVELVAKQENYNADATWKEHEEDFGAMFQPHENEFEKFMKGAGGKTALAVVENIDLGLWPDEQFFAKYRRSAAMAYWPEGNGWYGQTDLPGPSPRNSFPVETLTVAGVAIVAAIAIPSLLRSRIAANEVAAAAGCKAYIEAQEIYRRTDYDQDGVLEYAQAMKGDNSLLESKAGAGDLALVDRNFANAEGEPGQAVPKAGYCFKILKAQGALAPGGQKSYIVKGNMTLGNALLAYPAQYDSTGRNCFLISSSGTIYQRDFGPATHQIVSEITEFNPDEEWIPAE